MRSALRNCVAITPQSCVATSWQSSAADDEITVPNTASSQLRIASPRTTLPRPKPATVSRPTSMPLRAADGESAPADPARGCVNHKPTQTIAISMISYQPRRSSASSQAPSSANAGAVEWNTLAREGPRMRTASNRKRRPRKVPITPPSANIATPFQLQDQGAARRPSSKGNSSAGNRMLVASTTKNPLSTGMRATA